MHFNFQFMSLYIFPARTFVLTWTKRNWQEKCGSLFIVLVALSIYSSLFTSPEVAHMSLGVNGYVSVRRAETKDLFCLLDINLSSPDKISYQISVS